MASLHADHADSVDGIHTIKDGDYVVLCAGSNDMHKVVKVQTGDQKVRWIKSFVNLHSLIGCTYGKHYEMIDGGGVVESTYADVLGESTEEHSGRDHRTINQDYSSQKLSYDEIEKLKSDGTKGKDLINLLVENSASFQARTEFSQAKYIVKKQKRHLAASFTIRRPTIPLLCESTFSYAPERIQHIRIDSLAQLLTQANIHAGARVLLAESCKGLITAAVMERLGGFGECLSLYVGDKPSHPYVDNMNFSDKVKSTLRSYPLVEFDQADMITASYQERADSILADVEKKVHDWGKEITEKDSWWADRRRNKANRMKDVLSASQSLSTGNFDAVIICTKFHPKELVEKFFSKLANSRNLVIFSVMPEVLIPIRSEMRNREDVVNSTLFDTWTRVYQVLPQRTHAENNMTGNSGFILSTTKVLTREQCNIKAFKPPKMRKQKRGGGDTADENSHKRQRN
eukprot:CFRG5516T1